MPETNRLRAQPVAPSREAGGAIKTHTCERVEALRSKAPTRVAQEVWGLLLAYNLVRLVMGRAAPRAGVSPGRPSYRGARLALRV